MYLYHKPECEQLAQPLAAWFQLTPTQTPPAVDTFQLFLDQRGLVLLAPGYKHPYRLSMDECQRRVGMQGLLARAIGRAGTTVLDACAGLGIDGFGLAALGHQVTLVEQLRPLWALMDEFAERHPALDAQVRCADSLSIDASSWSVVYLDPMFAARSKGALPNRGMQHVQGLVQEAASGRADSVPIERWLTWARSIARDRVVVKRRAKDPTVDRPSHQLRGRSVRFDVYQLR